MRNILHTVVGAGNPGYFRNCISSILELTTDDVRAYYNWVSEEDFNAAKQVADSIGMERVTFIFQANKVSGRTGSLYEAQNDALSQAVDKYRYISFTQADMQMMWWDDRIVDVCDTLRRSHEEATGGELCFFTQIPVRGKRASYYSAWETNDGTGYREISGAVDVAIFPVNSSLARGLAFEGSEKEFSRSAGRLGFSVYLHPFPFLAPIPFPLTVRDRTRAACRGHRSNSLAPILKVAPDRSGEISFSRETFHPFFMEDFVWPNGWTSLTPYWPSDTLDTRWMRIRFSVWREMGGSLIGAQSQRGFSPIPTSTFRPGLRRTISALSKLLREEVTRKTVSAWKNNHQARR